MKSSNSDIQNKIFETVLKNLKDKGLDVSFDLVEKTCKSQWEFASYVIRFGQHESLRLKYLGLLGVKRFREGYMQERYLTREQREVFYNLPKVDRAPYLMERYLEYKERTKMEYSNLEKPVVVYNKKDKEVGRYTSLREASEKTKIAPIFIFISCSKSTRTKRGLKFQFLNGNKEEENIGNTEG